MNIAITGQRIARVVALSSALTVALGTAGCIQKAKDATHAPPVSTERPAVSPAAAPPGAPHSAAIDRDSAISGAAGPLANLVDLPELDPTFVLDIRYATPRNFTGEILYPVARCLLRPDVAERLVRVHERLAHEGLRLRIFDCYRPLSIQRRLWALVPDERYVADPAKGSRHNRGAAVDLTLADSSGAALPMPTEYDDFTPQAHRDYGGGDPRRLANRERLERAMAAEGFEGLPTEWWHFDAPGWKEHAILDVPLDSPLTR